AYPSSVAPVLLAPAAAGAPGGAPAVRSVLGRRGQLAAGSVDLPASSVAHRHRNPVGLQSPDEFAFVTGPGCGPLGAGRRVQRDRLDVYEVATQEPPKKIRQPSPGEACLD